MNTFKPAWWLPSAHLQTLWPALCRRSPRNLKIKRERIELPDSDFVDLDWVGEGHGPIILILHGLEGGISSSYVRGMLHAMQRQGWRGVLMHFRSCSGERNRLSRFYHSGDTVDVEFVIQKLHAREAGIPLAAIGFSLGGNVLLKWLGETGEKNLLTAAIAISVPFELQKSVQRINHGFSRVYQRHLLNSLRKKVAWKFHHESAPIFIPPLNKLRSIYEFDEKITAPLNGFASADDYYQKSSSRQYLHAIRIPTLLLQAKDDPFMTEDLLPTAPELSSQVKFEILEKGGHVGFVTGQVPWRARYWLEERVPAFLHHYL
jgi:predicted alpha/beta-fold hydrolase